MDQWSDLNYTWEMLSSDELTKQSCRWHQYMLILKCSIVDAPVTYSDSISTLDLNVEN